MEETLRLLEQSGAVRKGHFLLTSGLHSDTYVEKFRLLENPRLAGPLLHSLAERFQNKNVQVVLGPAVGGIIVAYEIARHLGVRAIFAEREEGKLTLRRGFQLAKGERCLIVEDIVTTGGSVKEVVALAKDAGAEIVGVALLIDRSGGALQLPYPTESLTTLHVPSWEPQNCPACRQGIPLERRGSRFL